MGSSPDKPVFNPRDGDSLHDQLDEQISEQLKAVKNPAERRTIAGLLREISHLPLEHTRAAIETGVAIAAVSFRAGIEFLKAVPTVAPVLEAAELRAWGEIGRRLTMNEVETGVGFFLAGVGEFSSV